MKREIWFLCATFDPKGGDSCRIVEIAHEARIRLGLRPIIISMRMNGQPKTECIEGIEVVRTVRQSGFSWNDLVYALSVCRQIHRRHASIAVLHINSPGMESVLVIRAAHRYGIRVVIQMTLMGCDNPQTLCQFRRYTRPVARMLVRRLGEADAILGLSKALVDCGIEFGWPSERVTCSAMAKDPALFRPGNGDREKFGLRDKLQIPRECVAVAYVGYLSKRKGTDILIKAWGDIISRFPNAILLLAGAFGKRGDISPEWFHVLSPSAYRLLGVLSRTEVAELLRAADIFVFPTRREGFGAVLLEAVMCGLPVVASYLPGITDMMVRDGGNGFLCEPGDADSLMRSLQRMIQSAELRSAMGRESSKIAKNFYPDVIWPVYRKAYTGE